MKLGVGMFGQRDDSNNSNNTSSAPAVPSGASQMPLTTPIDGDYDTSNSYSGTTVNGMNIDSTMGQSNPVSAQAPQMNATSMSAPTMSAPSMSAPAISGGDGSTPEDLISMKQEALKHLQPLVGNLRQSPEEEFRTLMMMIQATDDKTMLKKALESAKRINDDKARAQAMLDVINEINYFTQAQQG